MAGEEDGAGALAGGGEEAGLVGVTPMSGVGLGMACLTVILMEDMDQVTPTMVTVQPCPMATTPGKGIQQRRKEVIENAVWRWNWTNGAGADDRKRSRLLCWLWQAWIY